MAKKKKDVARKKSSKTRSLHLKKHESISFPFGKVSEAYESMCVFVGPGQRLAQGHRKSKEGHTYIHTHLGRSLERGGERDD